MEFKFNIKKTIQAIGLLMEKETPPVSGMRLLKLLYIVDKELLLECSRPLTGDMWVITKYGPILSQTSDLMKEIEENEAWTENFEPVGYRLTLKSKPQRGELCKREIEALINVVNKYRHTSDEELTDLILQFKEFAGNYAERTSSLISWEEVLTAYGKQDRIQDIEKEQAYQTEVDDLFGTK